MVAREACISGSQGTVAMVKTALGRLPAQDTAETVVWGRVLSLLWRRPLCLSWSFSQEQASGLAYTERPMEHSQEIQTVDAILALFLSRPCSSSSVSPRKGLIHLSGAPISVAVTQWTPPDHLVFAVSGDYACDTQDCICTFLKADTWRCGFQSAQI